MKVNYQKGLLVFMHICQDSNGLWWSYDSLMNVRLGILIHGST